MAAATAAQIKTQLSGLLKVPESQLAAHFTDICTTAATFADQEIKGRLYARGFTVTNVAGWDRLYEFSLDLGLWKALSYAGTYGGYDPNTVKELDRREELTHTLVFVSGEWVQPASGQPGTTTTSGPLAEDRTGVFNYSPSGDPEHLGIHW